MAQGTACHPLKLCAQYVCAESEAVRPRNQDAACCLFLQALVSLAVLEERFQYDYYMHADDDNYVRLDLILELLVGLLAALARTSPGVSAAHPSVQLTATAQGNS